MRILAFMSAVLSCCVFSFNDQTVVFLTSPRVLLVCGLLLWARFEWHVRGQRKAAPRKMEGLMVKENFEMSQTILRLSDQHRLLCEIRNAALNAAKCSRDVLVELKFSLPVSRLSSPSASDFTLTPESKPDVDPERCRPASPMPVDPVQRAKTQFRMGSMSDSGLTSCVERHSVSFVCSSEI